MEKGTRRKRTACLMLACMMAISGCTPAAYDSEEAKASIQEADSGSGSEYPSLYAIDISEYDYIGEPSEYFDAEALSSTDESGRTFKIAWINYDEADEQTAYITSCLRDLAAKYGIELICFDSQSDPQKQSTQIEQAVIQQCDGIIIDPLDASAENISLRKAREAGLIVICMTMATDDEESYDTYVGADEILAGQQAASMLMDAAPGGGRFVVIQGTLGAYSQICCDKGFNGVLQNYPGYEVIESQTGNWMTADAMSVMEAFLAKYDDIAGVYCHNDVMGLGANQAIVNAGREDEIAVVSIDGAQSAIDKIAEGSSIKGLSLLPIELLSEVTLLAMLTALNGTEVGRNVYVANVCVVPSNADQFNAGWGY